MNKSIIFIVAVALIAAVLAAYIVFLIFHPTANKVSPSQAATNIVSTIAKAQSENLKISIIKEGNGPEAKTDDRVIVKYVGMFEDGTKFDPAMNKDEPFTFVLGENKVIKGWEVGVLGMKVGERRRLTIPPELAYGENGLSPYVPPNATLIFDIDLLGILIK